MYRLINGIGLSFVFDFFGNNLLITSMNNMSFFTDTTFVYFK